MVNIIMNTHYINLNDYHGILILWYKPWGKHSINTFPVFEQLKSHSVTTKFLIKKFEHECDTVYINGKIFNDAINWYPKIYLHTKIDTYEFNNAYRTLENFVDFIEYSFGKEIIDNNIMWTSEIHNYWPNQKYLNEKIKTLLLISKKKHTSKYYYMNCFIRGICIMIIKNMCMIEKQ